MWKLWVARRSQRYCFLFCMMIGVTKMGVIFFLQYWNRNVCKYEKERVATFFFNFVFLKGLIYELKPNEIKHIRKIKLVKNEKKRQQRCHMLNQYKRDGLYPYIMNCWIRWTEEFIRSLLFELFFIFYAHLTPFMLLVIIFPLRFFSSLSHFVLCSNSSNEWINN